MYNYIVQWIARWKCSGSSNSGRSLPMRGGLDWGSPRHPVSSVYCRDSTAAHDSDEGRQVTK